MTAALPMAEPAAADLCIAKLRAMFKGKRPERGELLWGLLTTHERRFICKAARIRRALEMCAGMTWQQFDVAERVAIEEAWRRLCLLVERVQRGIARHA